MFSFTKNSVKTSFLTAFAVIAMTTNGDAQSATKVQIAVTNTDGYEAYFAQENGIFRRAGLTVEIQNLGQGAAVAAAISAHTVDVGISNVVTIAQARARGLQFAFVAPASLYLSSAPNTQIVVAPDSTIHTARDLNAKTIGVTSLAGITRLAAQAWIDQNGGDSTTAKFVEIPPSEMQAALERGTLPAAIMNDPILSAMRPKLRVVGSPFDAFGQKFLITGWFAGADWIAQNKRAVGSFAKAMSEAARWGNDPKNHAQAAAIIAKYTKGQSDPGQTVYAVSFDTAPFQAILDSALKYNLLNHPITADELVSRS